MVAEPVDQTVATSESATINNASGQLGKTAVVSSRALDSAAHDGPNRPFTSQTLPLLPESDTRRSKADYGQERVHEIVPHSPGPTSTACFGAGLMCPTKEDILKRPGSWLTVILLALAVYATVFSGIFLIIALMRPRWGERVGTPGHLTVSTATFLSALFSKTVEIAFVTISVTCLGQILSRRALLPHDNFRGISIAEMAMRTWIMQPGTLFTHWCEVRYAGTTLLGATALLIVFSSTFYTTAAEALVAPKLRLGPVQERSLLGKVAVSYANAPYLAQTCPTAVHGEIDTVLGYDVDGDTCLQVAYGGESFNNLRMFEAAWTNWTDYSSSDGTASYKDRPEPITLMYDRTNTTIIGQWITPSQENITQDSMRYGRLVQNLTLAMPHTNLLNAVQDRRNRIIQPTDLPGAEYLVEAAIPAPTLNILCVGLSAKELLPLIQTNTSASYIEPDPTALDDIFGWTTNYIPQYARPIFPKIPLPYNTIAYISSLYGPTAVYILATPPPDIITNEYIICSIQSSQYPNCTSSYRAAQTAGQLSVHCDSDPWNTMPYYTSLDPPDTRTGYWEPDFKDVGSEWLRSISLNSGVLDANASSARIVTQLTPQFVAGDYTFLPTTKPSIAEAIAVLGMGTLVRVSFSAPFVHYWNYSRSVLQEPQDQWLKTRLTFSDYASSPTQAWQNLFYVVLIVVFVFSIASTTYLSLAFTRSGCITDFTEPQNLFAVAINSPPSTAMAGTCGAGPHGEVLGEKWVVEAEWTGATPDHDNEVGHGDEKGRPHFYLRHQEEVPLRKRFSRQLIKREWTSIATTLHG